MPEVVSRGLEGVVVADSAMCYIDGQKGILRYRGIDISEMARYSSYEETAHLLWFGELPTRSQCPMHLTHQTAGIFSMVYHIYG